MARSRLITKRALQVKRMKDRQRQYASSAFMRAAQEIAHTAARSTAGFSSVTSTALSDRNEYTVELPRYASNNEITGVPNLLNAPEGASLVVMHPNGDLSSIAALFISPYQAGETETL